MQDASSSSSSRVAAPDMASYRVQVLEGDFSVYAFGQQASSQQKRQLDVLPVSAYGWDSILPPGSGRLIAVNRRYICYCLRSSGSVRILGRNVPSRGLFQGHTQRVTDIQFFAEDVNLVASVSLDGWLFVWRIVGNVGGERDFQLQQHVILTIQFEGAWKDVHPRVCWHPQSQEILMVCMSNNIFKIDVEKARTKASQRQLSEEAFLSCSTANLINGVWRVGHHDAEVTDLSVYLRDVLYIASACNNGMVQVWEDCKANPLTVLMPYDGQPVGSVFFLTCGSQRDKTALLTSDRTNKKLKLWVPAPSSRFSTWSLVQTLEFRSCDGIFAEEVFSNQICTAPEAGLVLLGNSETPALFSIHLKFDSAANVVRMNFLAEFSLSMPILSFTVVTETESSCKDTAHIFCVQTQAIQEYFLNVADCLSPQFDEPALVSRSAALLEAEFMKVSACKAVEGEQESKRSIVTAKEIVELATGNLNPGSGFGSWVEVPNWIAATVKRNLKVVSPLASGHGAGSVKSLMVEEEFSSTTAGNVCASLSPLPSLSVLSTSSGNSKMEENVLLPAGLDALSSGFDSESLKNDVTAVTSDLASEQFLNTPSMVDHQESESTREEGPHMILQGSRTISGPETTVAGHKTNTCFCVALEHCSGGIKIANAPVGLEEVKHGLLFAAEGNYKEHQEELAVPESESPSNNFKRKRTRRRRKRFQIATGIYKEQLTLPELESLSNISKRKRTRRRRKGLRFKVVKANYKEDQEELALPEVVSTNCKENQEEMALPELERQMNIFKKKRTRRRKKRSNKANRGIASVSLSCLASEDSPLLCRSQDYTLIGMSQVVREDTCPSPFNNGEDLSVQLAAIKESVDQLLTTQMELQKNLSTVVEVPLSYEIKLINIFDEDWISNYIGSHMDTIWRQFVEKSSENALQPTWTGQLRKAFDEMFTKESAPTFILASEVLSCVGSEFSLPISASVDNALVTSLPQILEGWNQKYFKFIEKSLDTILNRSLREQMENVLIGFWKHLIQVERKYSQGFVKKPC